MYVREEKRMRGVNKPVISIIMGVYDFKDQEILKSAIVSILQQSFTDYEFIIYDDGSEAKYGAFIEEISKVDKRIVLIGKKVNRGLAYSLNKCVEIARGDYIARMDADDISHIDRLKRQYEFLEEHPEYSWCGCNAYLFDESGCWGRRNMPERPENKDFLRFSPYIHPSVMYRKSIFSAGNRYFVSEDTLRCEDYDFFMRLHQLGMRGYNIQACLFYYRENRASYDRRNMKTRIKESKIRLYNFYKMGMLLPVGWLFAFRPIIGGIVPAKIIYQIKKWESDKLYGNRK